MSFLLITRIYYILAAVALFWMYRRYRSSSLLLFLLCVAFEGVFTTFLPGRASQMMRVVYVLWGSYLVMKLEVWKLFQGKMLVLFLTFLAFSIYFIWVSLFYNGDTFLMTFSQYSMYYIPFTTMLIFAAYHKKNNLYTKYFNQFFFELILIQIVSALVKALLFNFNSYEGMVGTFGGVDGGGAGTSFPLVALAWVLVNTNMEIRGWKSWLFVFGLLFIGIMTGKRAVVVLYPAFFILFSLFVAKKRYARSIMIAIALAPLLFYLGLRLTPTLNPENEVWGSFDIDYALNYGTDYSLGKTDSQGNREKGTGRVGADLLMYERIMDFDNYTDESWFGNGLSRVYSSAESLDQYYSREHNFGVDHRGSLTGFVMLYLSTGLIGFVLFMLYYFVYFTPVFYWRLRLSLYAMTMFDFIFYNAQIVRNPFIAILLVFIMYYSEIQYSTHGKYIGQTHKYFA